MAMNAKQTKYNKTSKMALLNTTIGWHQQDGNECQTKKTLNTTKLVGWQ